MTSFKSPGHKSHRKGSGSPITKNTSKKMGAFKFTEMAHSKKLSHKRYPLVGKEVSGKVMAGNAAMYVKASGAHGTTGQSKDNNMDHNTGGYRIGTKCRTFKSNHYFQAGPRSFGSHGQPAGHKSLSTNFVGGHIAQFHKTGKTH